MKVLIGLLASALLFATQECLAEGNNNDVAAPCPVVYPDRIWLQGLSVQPPIGDRWCATLEDGNSAVMTFAEDTTENQTPRRLIFWAHLDEVDGGAPTSMAGLKAFAEEWIRGGPYSTPNLPIRPA